MIFVDTSAWYARYVDSDIDHAKAVEWFADVPNRLVTTDYILDELFTLLKVRGFPEIAYTVGPLLLAGNSCQLEYISPLILLKRGPSSPLSVIKAGVSRTVRVRLLWRD